MSRRRIEGLTSSDERVVWIDVARGFLMALVVMYHTLPPQIAANLINPAACTFFFLSGLISRDIPLKDSISKRFKQIMIPYYTMALANTAIWLIARAIVPRQEMNFTLGSVIANILTVRTAVGIIPLNIIPLWFLPTVFVMEIYYSLLRRLRILIVGITIGFVSMYFFYGSLPFKLDVALAVLPYFALGKFVRSRDLFSKRLSFLFTALACSLYIITSAFCNEVYLMEDYFGTLPFLYVIAALIGIIAVSGLSQILQRSKAVRNFLSLFGRRTLFVLGYHIAAGFLVYPLFDLIGDPIEIMERFWFIYWIINMGVLYLMIRYIPEPVITALSGSFLAKRQRNPEKLTHGK
ncbi:MULTISPECIES: acyltransferase family protein [Mesotoga]|uniref:acyltransferase family protein n=1 Tax=Mesotoga TaxID=1184396 RepID=UPI0002CC4841|nr:MULTISPECIES: acyltransferase family protein [Mesotoga]CCU83717.1 Acyltransferase 3 [Mesotoga infera]PIJ63325.1 acyltransferase [Mesotoga sp. H07.pep.5.3]HNQ70614.1 acyltransferase family protein [Mesotoga prima]HNS75543.1 acyltransferase family protein [Mesotoga prima]HOP37978.1 acyltransferase family protein [Mesotoga prima]